MKIFRGLPDAESRVPCALTIGNFDGVHRGHQALLAELRRHAHARGLASCILTFEPHPREFFTPLQAPPRIYNLRDKLDAFQKIGIDHVVIAHFNEHFSSQTPDQFIQNILINGLNTRWLLVGDDFRFGAGGKGDFTQLVHAGQAQAANDRFDVARLETTTYQNMRISSSAIRDALKNGALDMAQTLLGRSYMVSGRVIHGAKLGRTLGFPTINLRLSNHRKPHRAALSGIFVAQVHGLAERPLPAVASLGVRPTVDNSKRELLEAHLFDFSQSVYGRLVKVELLQKLRDEMKYPDLDTLRAAITEDCEQAREWFTTHTSAIAPSL